MLLHRRICYQSSSSMTLSNASPGPYDFQSTMSPLFQAFRAFPSSSSFQVFKPSHMADGLAVIVFLFALLGYLGRGLFWDKLDPHYHVYFEKPQSTTGFSEGHSNSTRDIAQRLEEAGYQCVIFWGSQSGTAERCAEALGRECLARFGINALVADISDYNAETIASIRKKHFAIFLLSTYGEGDPSDNTAGLWDWIRCINNDGTKLESLRYVAFGLGNSNYKYYNRVLDVVADALDAAGAQALIPRQKADDANGATEEDFQSWKVNLFALFQRMGYEQTSIAYQPSIIVKFVDSSSNNISIPPTSPVHRQSGTNSAIVPLPVNSTHELFANSDRHCIHMELDLGSSDLGYKTGDHVGVWPCNPDEEVDRLVKALGLQTCRDEGFAILSLDRSPKPKLPSPSTIDIAFRHYLEICGPVARKTVLEIAQFAPTPKAKTFLLEFGQNRSRYEELVAHTHITLARLLQLASPIEQWTNLPLSFVIENLPQLQPRYYSISSSSVISPRKIAITALVVNKVVPGQPTTNIHGLTSNYLLSASNLATGKTDTIPEYRHISGTEGLESARIFVHVRKSKFKLPITSSTPLILVCAGTGFAPFRAFLQERAKLHAIGKPVGKMILFFGCRNMDDFIYQAEIEKIHAQVGDKLNIITAFSRDGHNQKKYVQDRVNEHASQVVSMLEEGASMYICGKANMAREVDLRLEVAVAKMKQLNEAEVKAWTDGLKKRGKWRVDVWG
jgi:NADPH-ferrihemoprotein reductase